MASITATLIQVFASGSIFTIEASPNGSTTSVSDNMLLGDVSITASDMWAVGIFQTPDAVAHPLTEHWDGSQWTLVSSPDG